MTRLTALLAFAGAGFVFSPATASAQFGLAQPNFGTPMIVPSFNPFYYVPQYRYDSFMSLNMRTMTGNVNVGMRQFQYGMTNPTTWALAPLAPLYYPQSSSYMSGDARPNLSLQAQRDLARAQRAMSLPGALEATPASAKRPIVAGPASVVESGPPVSEAFDKILAPAERARVVSGEALNDLLAAIVKAEPKVGERPSAFVPPLQLDDVRFGGSEAADVLNLVRRPLDFPVALDDPALKELRTELGRDFAAVVAELQAGKSPEAMKRMQLEITLEKVEAALPPVVKNLSSADAAAASSFTNQLTTAVKAMKAGVGNGLIDPKWATEGTTVADLVKYMTRHKLRFAAAPSGNEESYITLHRNFATYLFLLTQPKK